MNVDGVGKLIWICVNLRNVLSSLIIFTFLNLISVCDIVEIHPENLKKTFVKFLSLLCYILAKVSICSVFNLNDVFDKNVDVKESVRGTHNSFLK